MIFELLVGLVVVVLLVVLIGFTVDKLTVGGDGIWYGSSEPPEGFVGFWDKGHIVVQWPTPGLVVEGDLIEEDIRVQRVFEDLIVVNELSADRIVAGSITAEDIIPDPDFPGALTTKQELARRRSGEK